MLNSKMIKPVKQKVSKRIKKISKARTNIEKNRLRQRVFECFLTHSGEDGAAEEERAIKGPVCIIL